MKILSSSRAAARYFKNGCALSLGNFDGLHKGHRFIIRQLVKKAQVMKVPSVVYTFEPHPVRLLAPDAAPALINTLRQKLELLEETGVDMVIVEPFKRTFANISARGFFDNILLQHLNAKYIVVGYDFTFGKKREGNIETLESFGRSVNIPVEIIKPQMLGDTLPSSSLVRKLLQDGQIKKANRLLMRPYFVDGTIIHGHARGTAMGFPTANLKQDNELLLRHGVYITSLQLNSVSANKQKWPAITNVGTNPTFGKNKVSIETFLLNFDKNIYDKKVRLFFHDIVREEMVFENSSQLVRQIKQDIKKAQRWHLKKSKPSV